MTHSKAIIVKYSDQQPNAHDVSSIGKQNHVEQTSSSVICIWFYSISQKKT